MVRRLSYINNFNEFCVRDFKPFQIGRINVSCRTVYWARKKSNYRFITRNRGRRVQWRRRKHNFEYILYTNILGMWSTEYTFFKKMIKFNYNYCISKSSLLVYNLAVLRGTCPSIAKHSEHTYLATLPKTIVNYFLKLQSYTHPFWRQQVGTLVTIGSFFINNPTDEVFKMCLISPSHLYTTTTLVPYQNDNYLSKIDCCDELFFQLFVKYNTAILVELYRIHVLLVLYTIHTVRK